MGRSFIFLCFAVFFAINSSSTFAQPRGVLEVIGRLEQDNKPLTNGTIRVLVDGRLTETHNPNILGRFELYLQYDVVYIVEFTAPGLITKRIKFDTNMPERTSRRHYHEFSFAVDLFPFVEEIDLSFFEEELVTVEYIERSREFSYAEEETADRLRTANDLKRLVEEYIRKKRNYDRHIAEGDTRFESEELRVARESYISALDVFPNEPYPAERIRLIDELLAQQDVREREVQELLAEAEKLMEENKFEEAEALLNQALGVIPGDAGVRGRVEALQQRQIRYRQDSGAYLALIQQADDAYDGVLYRTALDLYRGALEIRPNEEHPLSRVEEIEGILAELRELRRKYEAAIENADNYYRMLNYENALEYYQEAISYLPDEEHPRERIEIINRHLFNVQQREEQYSAAIQLGDNLFDEEKYQNALEAYLEASGLKPAETYPKERIDLTNKMIRELANVRFQYNRAIEQGDNAFSVERYANALVFYRSASELLPNEEYPREMLAKINDVLMDRAEIDAKYNEYIQAADLDFNNQNFQDSKSSYQEALLLKPKENYPAQRIAEINNILDGQELGERYNNMITNADEKFNTTEYTDALALYNEASKLMPYEQYPRQRIGEINNILERMRGTEEQYASTIAFADRAFENREYARAKESYQRALGYKPNEIYPQNKIEEIDGIMANLETEERYQAAINSGDNAFNRADYTLAISKYREALEVRPDEAYPKGKITEAERLLAEAENTDRQYNEVIANADRAFNQRDYDAAIGLYQTARNLKPNEEYPISRLDEINLMLAQQRSVEMQYNNLLQQAEEAFNINQYSRAIDLYNNALQLMPDEVFPQQQIEMINAIIAETDRLEQEYREAIANADRLFQSRSYQRSRDLYFTASELKPEEEYPRSRLAELDRILERQRGVEETYQTAIAEADRLFNQQNYNRAKESYSRASRVKPSEAYPRNQIAEIDRILAGEFEESVDYTASIESGDRFFRQRQFFRARDAYQQALSMRPNEEYPQQKIVEINEILAKGEEMDAFYNRGFMDVSNVREVINNNVEKRYYFVPFERRRTGSYLMVKGENLSERNIRLFINYGKDRTRLGGFTVTIGAEEGVQELKIDISSQRRWISDESNWISIYPQGGDLEVLQVQIFFGQR